MRICVTVNPFAEASPRAREILEAAGHEVLYNPHDRKILESEIVPFASRAHALIAGTEPITNAVMAGCPELKVISRVGSGYDSVDLDAARRRGIVVAYAPRAPVMSVAELVIALAIDGLRGIAECDRAMHEGRWIRPKGQLLGARTVGIAGVGRIGSVVARLLSAFGSTVLGHDIAPDPKAPMRYVGKDELLAASEVLFIHLPLNQNTRNWLGAAEIAKMRPGAVLINAARGGMVDEAALADALKSRHLSHAALDVFAQEPYRGPLSALSNITLTAHIGAMAQESRIQMELEAVANALEVLAGRPPNDEVPYP